MPSPPRCNKRQTFILVVMKFFLVLSAFLLTISASAFQDQPLRELDRTLETYYQNVTPLKVHLTINQSSFVPGDTAFFRASVVSERDQKFIDKTSILHVMLINAAGNAVTNQKVRLENGTANNQLVIPTSVKPGLYVLVAYHDWMKNGPSEFFFQTFILIHGPLQFAQHQNDSLQFFPEGGHLIAGVENRVVAKGPINTVVKITDENGETQSTLATNEHGFASFKLKPLTGKVYRASVGNRIVTFPQPESEGVSISVKDDSDENRLAIALATAQETLQRVRVIADARGKIYVNQVIKLEQGSALVNVPTVEMQQGVARISVFSDKGNLLAQRLVFVLSDPAYTGTVSFDRAKFNTRQKVTAKVKVTGSGELAGTILSASVVNRSLYKGSSPVLPANIALYSNVPGSMTNAMHGFSVGNKSWQESIDMLLIASHTMRTAWTSVLQKNLPLDKLSNIRFTGELVNEKTGALMTDTTFVTLFLQKNVVIYQTFASKGRFDLPLYIDFFGMDEVYYRIEKRGKLVPDVRIRIVEEPALSVNWPVVEETTTPDPVFVNARQKRLISNAFGYSDQTRSYKKVASPHVQLEEEIFGADVEIDLEKYLVFPSMEETIREIIPMVQHRKVKNVSTIRVYFSDINRQAVEGPVYSIDGVMTDDTDYFMRLKPSEISKIKIVNTREKLKTFGAIGRGGVIMVETKLPDNFNKVPRSKNSFVVHGLSEPFKIKSFDAVSYTDRIPDLRSSLYWNPHVELDDNGEATVTFYTSDVTGEHSIILEGITPSGDPLFIEGNFSVEFNPNLN